MEPKGQPPIHKCPQLAHILSQINPVYISSHSLKILFKITLSSNPRYFEWCLSLTFFHQNLYVPLFSPIGSTCPTHLNIRDLITEITFGDECRS